MNTKKFLLEEKDIPTAWYNIVADMENKPMPMLNPQTKKPLTEEDIYPLFSKAASHQEMNTTDAWIEIPEEVRDLYKVWRPTPLVRAYGLEKALDTPAHIYFKNESVSPIGSHKLNSALAQAYYNRDRCRSVGCCSFVCSQGIWIGIGCLYGKGQLSSETLSPFDHADFRSTGNSISQYEYTCRTKDSNRSSELSR